MKAGWQEEKRFSAGHQNLCIFPLSTASVFRKTQPITEPAMVEAMKAAKKKGSP
jgi:hypothetical protein